MNTMPTYRRGRRVYQPGANDKGGLGGICSVLTVLVLLVAPPIALLLSESFRRESYVALREALETDIYPLPASCGSVGALVHATSHDVRAVSSDRDMHVSVPGALSMRRRTEYCQWQEVRREDCETCSREVRAADGSTKEERYRCNCVAAYDYVKAWRGHRINSILFDRPAAHHNPQRDPMPSATFPAEEAAMRADDHRDEARGDSHRPRGGEGGGAALAVLDPSMLSGGVRGARWRTVDFVPRGVPPAPSSWTRWFVNWIPDRTRYEPTDALRDIATAPAAVGDNFVYVGGSSGYFFSPYNADVASDLFKYFMQYMEGSLFDWQIGDIMPSCTAGDVRFRYEVQDPAEISVLGEVAGHTRTAAMGTDGTEEEASVLRPKTARNGRTVGLVHAGRSSPQAMIAAEDSDSRWATAFPRLLLLPWAAAASRLLGALAGVDVHAAKWPTQLSVALSLWCLLVGLAWIVNWGCCERESMEGPFLLAGAVGLGITASRRLPRSDVPRGPNALWCMLGRWANVPPSWRVEKAYANEGRDREKQL